MDGRRFGLKLSADSDHALIEVAPGDVHRLEYVPQPHRNTLEEAIRELFARLDASSAQPEPNPCVYDPPAKKA